MTAAKLRELIAREEADDRLFSGLPVTEYLSANRRAIADLIEAATEFEALRDDLPHVRNDDNIRRNLDLTNDAEKRIRAALAKLKD